MKRRLLRLINSYQDLCARYGAEDPVVKDLAAEIILCESAAKPPAQGERRKEKTKKYSLTRNTPQAEQSAPFLH